MDAVKLLGSLLSNNSMGSNILGSLLGGGGNRGGGGGAGALLGSLLGGGNRGGGGAGALLGSLLGGGNRGGGGGGAGALLGSLLGGGQKQQTGGGGAAGLLGSLLGGGGGQQQQAGGSGAAGLLGGLLGGGGGDSQEQDAPQQDPNDAATLLISAMCGAAKADGNFDDSEKEAIIGRLGDDVDQAEIDFIQSELAKPVDAAGFARTVPRGMEPQAYAFSVMGIKIDEQSEVQYLSELAQGLNLDANTCNEIHEQLGAPKIFR